MDNNSSLLDESNKGDLSPRKIIKARKEGRQHKAWNKSVPPKAVRSVQSKKISAWVCLNKLLSHMEYQVCEYSTGLWESSYIKQTKTLQFYCITGTF